MATNIAWNLGDVPDDARDAALRCAMREGVPIGEWMTRQILKGFSELKVRDQAQMLDELGAQVAGLVGRFDKVADQGETEALREAVKRLHQGLARIASELGEKASGSAVQVAKLADNLEALAGSFEALRSETEKARNGLDARLAQTAGQLTIQISSLASNLEALAEKLSGAQSEAAGASARLERSFTKAKADYDGALARQDEQSRAIAVDLAELTQQVEVAQGRAQEAADDLERRLAVLNDELAGLSARQSDALRTNSAELETLKSELTEARAHATEKSEFLDRRLEGAVQDIRNLGAGHSSAHRELAERLEKISDDASHSAAEAARAVDGLRSDAAERDDALRRRLAVVDCAFADLSQRQTDATKSHEERLDEFASQLDAIRSQHSDATDTFEQRFDLVRREIQDAISEHDGTHQRLTERLEQIRRDSEEAVASLAQSLSVGRDEIRALDTRHGELAQALEQRIEALHGSSDEREQAWAQRFAYVDQCLANIRENLEDGIREAQSRADRAISTFGRQWDEVRAALAGFDARQYATDETLNTWSLRFEAIERNIAATTEQLETQLRSHAEQSVATFGQQLQDVRNSLDERDVRETENKRELIGKLDDVVAQLSGSSASANRQFAAVQEQIDRHEARHQSAAQALEGMKDRDGATSASIAELADKITNLQERLDDPRAEHRFAAIARSQAELVGRQSVDDAVQAIEEKIQSLEASQRSSLSEFKAELLEAAMAAVNQRLDAGEKRLAEAIESLKAQPVLPPAPQTSSADSAAAAEFEAPPFVGPPPFAASPIDGQTEAPPLPGGPVVFPPPHDDRQSAQAGLLEPLTSVTESVPSEPDPLSAQSFISAARRSAQANAAQDAAATTSGRIDGLLGRWSGLKPQYKFIAGIAGGAVIVAVAHLWLQHSLNRPSASVRAPIPVHKLASSLGAAKTSHLKPTAGSQPFLPASQHSSVPSTASQMTPAQKTEGAAAQPGPIGGTGIVALADAGNARAELVLGLRAFADKQNPASAAEAVKWLSRAAKQGDAIAQYHLGMLYQQGRGVPADAVKAFALYEAAANAGNRDAMNNLGVAYAQGSGTAKNYAEAVQWFSTAAKFGLVEAQFDLAVLYERGEGIPQSLANAYRWYAVAAKEGDEGSKSRADALATQISPQDRAAADEFAAEFKPEPIDPQANIAPPLSGMGSN